MSVDESGAQLNRFLERSRFLAEGAVILDLDGTAVHEKDGKLYIPETVELGLEALNELGHSFVLNSLRFPLSIMRTFGRAWHQISAAPIPVVSMNGSLLGHIEEAADGGLTFDELAAFPLHKDEIRRVLDGVGALVQDDVTNLLLFYYPRDWRQGEIIWTPISTRIEHVARKYKSASSVICVPIGELRERLVSSDICMIFLLIDVPRDRLMAYQHQEPSSFFTHTGVDKSSGTREIAVRMGFTVADSVGAGDTQMDRFLDDVGLAVHVGPNPLPFRGRIETIRLPDSYALGELLFRLARVHQMRGQAGTVDD